MYRTTSSSSSLDSLVLGSPTSQSSLEEIETCRPSLPEDSNNGSLDYVMVVGGLGYIGSHTALELLKANYNVLIIDNLANAYESALLKVRKLANEHHARTGTNMPSLKFYKLDYRSSHMRTILGRYAVREPYSTRLSHITSVIHFAAHKSVEESILNPLDYYQNNVCGLVDLLILLQDFGIHNFVFSSSATVYGLVADKGEQLREEDLVHHDEEEVDALGRKTRLVCGVKGLTSPYGRSKFLSEAILADLAYANPSWRITALRYFNPVGSESTGLLGEKPRHKPTNLFPVISEVLNGSRPVLQVFGSDWEGSYDGTPVRDFIHVVDLARGHVAALAAAEDRQHAFRAYNLGTGKGSTVAEVINSMQRASGRSIPVEYVGRRPGDVGYCVAATTRAARELNWQTQHSLLECAEDTWRCLEGLAVELGDRFNASRQ
jgi:UDP-glucose 4-epimerase